MSKIFTIIMLFCFLFFNICAASATNDKSSLLSGSGYYKKQLKIASKPSDTKVPHDLAIEGKKLIVQTLKKYKIHPDYGTPDIFGFKMVVWLPAKAWDKMDLKQKAAIEGYMASKYTNWGVGIGRVSGEDILADEIVASH